MINDEYWKDQLQNLDLEELKEVENLINEYKKLANTREEFIDVIRRWAKKYPNAKYFFVGGAWKGAYDCEGEWGVRDWSEIHTLEDVWEELIEYAEENDDDYGHVEILSQFNLSEEWKNSILNFYIDKNKDDFKQFTKEFNDSRHKPVHKISDAEDLYNGEASYEFIDLETEDKKYLYTHEY